MEVGVGVLDMAGELKKKRAHILLQRVLWELSEQSRAVILFNVA